jgi:formylglycine-generating enzyme required for sulfatase activity
LLGLLVPSYCPWMRSMIYTRLLPAAFLIGMTISTTHAITPERIFRDCADCPEMVAVPAGSFMMGSNAGSPREDPTHKVTIAKPFAVGKFDVTFAEWDACVTASSCKHKPEDQGWGRGTRPVINVSWDDATKEYLPWFSRRTGKRYRLLTEARVGVCSARDDERIC